MKQQQGMEIRVYGIVQGVGFRPFIHQLARQHRLNGFVANNGNGVVVQIEPPLTGLDSFLDNIRAKAPPLACVTAMEQRGTIAGGRRGFVILGSRSEPPSVQAMIPPDTAICDDCLGELLDPRDRRYGYPFINCTNCGPRFTIINSLPYDRPRTSMKVFPMCASCAAEYHDPTDRRFHAQPIACWDCGPRLSWHDGGGCLLDCSEPIRTAAEALLQGKIVAGRGVGGFHLMVDSAADEAVQRLRRRKERKDKPLAVMAADVTVAEKFCHISAAEKKLLLSPEHPIVLLRKQRNNGLARAIVPGLGELGIMLPYAPFHHLLFAAGAPRILVMTSANLSEEPVCIDNQEAMSRLAGVADFFLLHDREILSRNDDSLVRISQGRPRLLRRARGYAPLPLQLKYQLPEILACGGELKNTFCLAHGKSAFLSQHIGDLVNGRSVDFYEEAIARYHDLFAVQPKVVACDLHPDSFSSRFAQRLSLPLTAVQHHHAHAAAVMAEHGLQAETMAVILDGAGFGPDSTIWGGEILLADLTSFRRLAHLQYLPLPGGDAAARQGWRTAMAACHQACGPNGLRENSLPPPLAKIPRKKRKILLEMIARQVNTPLTSSCGRLFDVIAALLDLRQESSYEGQAAMELENLARGLVPSGRIGELLAEEDLLFPVDLNWKNGLGIICRDQMIRTLLAMLDQGIGPERLALEFHLWLTRSITAMLKQLSATYGRKTVVLGGGCLQNSLLLEGLFFLLEHHGFQVFTGEQVPVNDGGLALGQAVIGGLRYVSGRTHAGH